MYKCQKCGKCCRSIGGIEAYSLFDRGDGVCKNLDEETNMCKIYTNRPLICNIDKMYDYFFLKSISRSEYYELNYQACRKFQEKH